MGDDEMKQGKRPTCKQKRMLMAAGKHPSEWLKERESEDYVQFVHRYSDKTTIKIWKE
jgi:hypothetical protein